MKDIDLLFWLCGGGHLSLWPPAALLQVLPPREWRHVHFKDGPQQLGPEAAGASKELLDC